ncbi:hypothetical protein [Ensifer aridi]|uniref:hypothetical protein n=1 Tax=Ensifer aridi TaxID=1708715 RepID=UPI000416FCE5|nr:hypothetical protein [Ensifer aridi]
MALYRAEIAAGPTTRIGQTRKVFSPSKKFLRVFGNAQEMAEISTSGLVAAALLKKSPFVDFSQKTLAIIGLWQ